jgi:hypothetical protein
VLNDDVIYVEEISQFEDEYQKETIAVFENVDVKNDWAKFEQACLEFNKTIDEQKLFFNHYDDINLYEVNEDGVAIIEFEKGEVYSVHYDTKINQIKDIYYNCEYSILEDFEVEHLVKIIDIIQSDEDITDMIKEDLEELGL